MHSEDACKGLEGWVCSVGAEGGGVGCGGVVEVPVCVDEDLVSGCEGLVYGDGFEWGVVEGFVRGGEGMVCGAEVLVCGVDGLVFGGEGCKCEAAGLVGDWLECVGKIFEGLDDGVAGGGEDLLCMV